MLSKMQLRIDLGGQIFLLVLFFVGCLQQVEAFGMYYLYFLLFIGGWQFFNGIVAVVICQNTTRLRYVIFAATYLVGLFLGDTMQNTLSEFVFFGYFFIGTAAFWIWYFWRTFSDLRNEMFFQPRRFWDFKF